MKYAPDEIQNMEYMSMHEKGNRGHVLIHEIGNMGLWKLPNFGLWEEGIYEIGIILKFELGNLQGPLIREPYE